jgi:tRNA(Ile)-lysidine synthase
MHYNAGVFPEPSMYAMMTTLPDPVLAQVVQAQRRYILFPPLPAQRPVVVAVSGGLDSVALLHILMQMAADWQLNLYVTHIDHALRPVSAIDAGFVRDLAAQAQTPFHAVRLDGEKLRTDPAGLEAAARHARYRALCTIACNVTPPELVPLLVVAHHAQDQAETLLLRLVQGSGLTGLAAMRPVTLLDDAALTPRPVRVVRPLLSVTRTELVAYTRRHNLSWREDESNADTTHSRNLLRHDVLPLLARLNPQVVQTLARTATLLADDADRLDAHDRQMLQTLAVVQDVTQDPTRVLLDLAGLQRLPEGDRRGRVACCAACTCRRPARYRRGPGDGARRAAHGGARQDRARIRWPRGWPGASSRLTARCAWRCIARIRCRSRRTGRGSTPVGASGLSVRPVSRRRD